MQTIKMTEKALANLKWDTELPASVINSDRWMCKCRQPNGALTCKIKQGDKVVEWKVLQVGPASETNPQQQPINLTNVVYHTSEIKLGKWVLGARCSASDCRCRQLSGKTVTLQDAVPPMHKDCDCFLA